jgi:DNA-binding transcriptional LysR family regulator
VSGGKVDVGFLEGLGELRGLANVGVVTDNLVLVVSPSHPWAGRVRPIPGPELASEPLVMREVGSGTREVLERALDSSGLAATPLAELGSTTAVKAPVADGRLIEVPTVDLDLGRSIRAVWSGRRKLGGPAKQLLTCAGTSAER